VGILACQPSVTKSLRGHALHRQAARYDLVALLRFADDETGPANLGPRSENAV
jgi:hypothetical protein